VVLGGCAGGTGAPLRITGLTAVTGPDAAACSRLTAGLPRSLGSGRARRAIVPATAPAAAWGKAPIVLTCGVPGVARTYRPTSMLASVDGVGWFEEDLGPTVRYSTPTRRPQVVLTMPADVSAFDVLTTLAGPVSSATHSITP
jgi:Protein of unknown function (DUF3515)